MRTRTSRVRRRPHPWPAGPATWTVVWAGMLALAWVGAARAAAWTLPLTIRNGDATEQLLELGIDPRGTYGVDPQLGEVGLPPWPPTAVFDARFMIDGVEGLRLDIRDDTQTERNHLIQWQAGTGGYPIVVRWNRAALPPASFTMSDGYTGTLIPPFDMTATDSLLIPGSQSFIRRLRITVVPGEAPPAPPAITPAIPNATVFVGQRFPALVLDDFVTDPDTPDADLQWQVAGDGPPWITVGPDRVLRVESPSDWAGTGVFTLRVVDPGGLEDEQAFSLTAVPGGLPAWSRPLTVANNGGQQAACDFGLHPDATDGIDAALGEVALPPWPPGDVFEARLRLPDALTHSRRDLRASGGDAQAYHLEWQAGAGGYPVTVSWPADLPPGAYSIGDEFGGAFVPPLDMSVAQSLVVPEPLSFITGLLVTATAVVDTTPPQGPAALRLVSHVPNVTARLDWSGWPCVEEHFAYYEVLFDTVAFYDEATFAWDRANDSALALAQTTGTTVSLPVTASGYVFRIRAWDAFGNAGPVSSHCYYGSYTGLPPDTPAAPLVVLDRNVPNPFNPLTRIRFSLERETVVSLEIFDTVGRRVRQLFRGVATPGPHDVVWDGRTDAGAPAPSGTYLCRLEAEGCALGRKMSLLK